MEKTMIYIRFLAYYWIGKYVKNRNFGIKKQEAGFIKNPALVNKFIILFNNYFNKTIFLASLYPDASKT